MSTFVTVAFRVRATDAEKMMTEAVFLDVFGNVRWSNSGQIVDGTSRWLALPESTVGA